MPTDVGGSADEMFGRVRAPARTAVGRVSGADQSQDFVMILGYEDVKRAARDWETFSSDNPGSVPIPHERLSRSIRQLPIEVDPPAHRVYRSLIDEWFGHRRLDLLEAEMTAVADDLISGFLRRGRCEVVEELALPMVLRCLAIVFGRPPADAAVWAAWGRDVYPHPDGVARIDDHGLDRYLADVVDRAQRNPGDDLFGHLATAEVWGRALTRDEMIGLGNLLLAAGRGTLVDAITGSMWYLGAHPAERARIVAQPELLPVAVEEFLRYLSPLVHIGRLARIDTALGDREIPKDALVSLGFAHANRDPTAFADPDRCLIDRRPNRHVAFGHGPHTCVGAHLARLELRVLLRALLHAAPAFHLREPVRSRHLDLGFDLVGTGFEALHVEVGDR